MGRVSRAQAEENRQRIVAAASRLFRERGTDNVSVADLMNEVGLTHGGFYKQFASKEALQAEALAHGLDRAEADVDGYATRLPGHAAVREALLDAYLSPDHRDAPGTGCPTAGFATDVARTGPGPLRDRYAAGVRRYARRLTLEGAGVDGGGADAGGGAAGGAVAGGAVDGGAVDPAALATLCTMVGAVLLARATAGDPVSGQILAAAREACRAPGAAAGGPAD